MRRNAQTLKPGKLRTTKDGRPRREGTTKKPQVYIFGWPGFLGGADTKLHHLLLLLHDCCEFTVVPNEARHLMDETWTRTLNGLGVRYALLDDLPARLEAVAL